MAPVAAVRRMRTGTMKGALATLLSPTVRAKSVWSKALQMGASWTVTARLELRWPAVRPHPSSTQRCAGALTLPSALAQATRRPASAVTWSWALPLAAPVAASGAVKVSWTVCVALAPASGSKVMSAGEAPTVGLAAETTGQASAQAPSQPHTWALSAQVRPGRPQETVQVSLPLSVSQKEPAGQSEVAEQVLVHTRPPSTGWPVASMALSEGAQITLMPVVSDVPRRLLQSESCWQLPA
jgi:hypothetical protein